MSSLPVSTVWIDRTKRQRSDLGDLSELKGSIQAIGLINPIVVKKDGQLIAGERRFTAIKELGWTHVPVTFREDLDDLSLRRVELDENIRRLDLPWKDLVLTVLEYHEVCIEQNGKQWSQEQTSEAIGISQGQVSNYLAVAKALREGVKLVTDAPQLSVAVGVVSRLNQRKSADEMEKLNAIIRPAASVPEQISITELEGLDLSLAEEDVDDDIDVPLQLADFRVWAPAYTGPRFNLFHCDFPYGIRVDAQPQAAGKRFGAYDDSKDIFLALLDTLAASMDNVVAESAHMIFWFSMNYYASTLRKLREMGWKVNPMPLIWHKVDNSGIIPDVNRSPRQIYETAFLCSRGDRFIVKPKANCIGYPNKKEVHSSEKPLPMLQHFFEMLVDDTTRMLDPTCGSGNAVQVAVNLGAASALGLEQKPEFHEAAVAAWRKRNG